MLDPLTSAASIREDYERYLRTTFAFRDRQWTDEFAQALQGDVKLTKGPYLEVSPPYEAGRSPSELIESGLLTPLMERLAGAMPLDRPLYLHQEQALEKAIRHRRNLVVATGTGSGKTECFLLSILDGLLREEQLGTLKTPGVRALLLYPMNALANDQVKRLRRLLARLPEVTFGRYVGETTQDRRKAEEDFRHRYPHEPRIPNELVSREAMQDTPPHILLTNFAMLEYLLLRPRDSALFDGPTGRHWRYLVLDEAHVYDGAKGTEIAMLLRRVRDRVNGSVRRQIQCFATSATLGRGVDDYPAITEFAQRLFDEPFEWSEDPLRRDVIGPRRKALRFGEPDRPLSSSLRSALLKAHQEGAGTTQLADIARDTRLSLSEYEVQATPERFLATLLSRDPAIHRCWDVMQGGSRSLESVAADVFKSSSAQAELVDLVALGTRARMDPESAPLLPARYHFFVRSLEGAYVCLHPEHPSTERRLRLARHEACPSCRPNREAAMFELGSCRRCGAAYLCGELAPGDRLLLPRIGAPLAYLLLGKALTEGDDDEDEVALQEAESTGTALYVCPACRRVGPDSQPCDCSGVPVIRVSRAEPRRKGDVLRRCLACAGRANSEIVLRVLTGADAPVAVIATSLYQQLPPTADMGNSLVGEGRKLLCFSDSRQDAAFFAPYIERTYGRALRRRLIHQALREAGGTPLRLEELVLPVVRAAEVGLVLDPEASHVTRRSEVRSWLMQEVVAPDRRQSLDGVGLAETRVAFPARFQPPAPLLDLGLSDAEVRSLLQLLLRTLWSAVAVTFPPDVDVRDEAFEPRNRELGCRLEGCEPGVIAWLPAVGSNRRLDLLEKVLNAKRSSADPRDLLRGLWDYLTSPNGPWSKTLASHTDRARGTLWRISHDSLEFAAAGDDAKPLVCSTCRQVQWQDVAGVCSSYRCNGLVTPPTSQVLPGAHYRKLYESLRPIGLVAQEHTAQWTPDEASRIQDSFVRGEVNVLSCSTTFELGVDVGEVEAVLLRNVPPSPSNYLQRAGRAGRRTTAAAFVVTYAQRRNHDNFHYATPEHLIDGVILPPTVYLDNANIVRRHVHSVAFAAFERLSQQPHETVSEFFRCSGQQASACDEFVTWMRGRPAPLGEILGRIVPTQLAHEVGLAEWTWVEALVTQSDTNATWGWLARAKDDVVGEIAALEAAESEASLAKKHARAAALQRQRRTVETQRLLSFLASRNVLPKYGFPVDVVVLDLARTGDDMAARIELDRDLRIAIVEFAPEAELVAGKALWRSRGLGKRPDRDWPVRGWAVCGICGAFRQGLATPLACTTCGATQNALSGEFVIPVFGFVGARADRKQPGEARPPSAGFVEVYFSEYQANDPSRLEPSTDTPKVSYRYSRQGRITVLNRGQKGRGFEVCEWCGFGRLPPDGQTRRGPRTAHADPRLLRDCNGPLVHRHLGHEFLTDVLELRLDVPRFGDEAALSTLYALLAATPAAGVRLGEMDGTVFRYSPAHSVALILIDDVPGGAGHALRVSGSLRAVFEAARRNVARCECGVDSSCYSCLRHYRNQRWHDVLTRQAALEVLDAVLGRGEAATGSIRGDLR